MKPLTVSLLTVSEDHQQFLTSYNRLIKVKESTMCESLTEGTLEERKRDYDGETSAAVIKK